MKQPSLAEIQRWMKRGILTGTAAPSAQPLVNPQRGTPGEERLAVYAVGYLVRMREALRETYEAVHHALGDRRFGELAEAYATQHPSADYNLSFIGRHLEQFLKTSPLTDALPFLPDLARLEWHISLAFHAAEQPPLNPSTLANIPAEKWETATLTFQPAVSVVASAWPILDIWQARARPHEAVSIEVVDRPQQVLVSRRALEVHCELIEARQCAVLEGLLAGRSLGQVLGEVASALGEKPDDVTAWFANWRRHGLIVTCQIV